MNPEYNIKNQALHPGLMIKNGEINKNNAKEYYKESKGGVFNGYAYFQASNKDISLYMEDNARSVENFNGDGGKILFCIFDGFGGIKVSKYLQDYFSICMKQILPS